MSGTINSVITNRDRNCLICRLVSGIGIVGAGLYVRHHSQKFPKNLQRHAMGLFGHALIILGIVRIVFHNNAKIFQN